MTDAERAAYYTGALHCYELFCVDYRNRVPSLLPTLVDTERMIHDSIMLARANEWLRQLADWVNANDDQQPPPHPRLMRVGR